MEPSLTDTLCTQCGLCCDGTLFADVELSGPAEATRLEAMGLDILDEGDDGAQMQLPCVALKGTRCSVYAHRPRCCRSFECQLLFDARAGVVTVARAMAHIRRTLSQVRRVRRLLGPPALGADRLPLRERCAEALAAEAPSGAGSRRRRAELPSAMADVERSIRTTFLGRRVRGRSHSGD